MLMTAFKNWKSLMKIGSTLAIAALMTNQTSAQCESWEAYPAGVEKAKEQHVIYKDMFKSKKYAEAFPTWLELFKTVKIPLPAKTTHFSDGITMYKEFAKVEQDKAKKEGYIKEIMSLYDQMATCLGERAIDRAWQGYSIYSLEGDSKKAIEYFEKAMELGKDETPNMIFVPMAQLSVFLFSQKDPKFTADYMRALYDKLKGIAEHNIKNNEKEGKTYEEKWNKVEEEFKQIGGQIWGCEFHVAEWKPKFEKDKYNMTQNEQIVNLLKKKCGVENELYLAVNAIYEPWKDSVDYEEAKAKFDGLCNLKKARFREMESRKAKKAGDETGAEKLKDEAFEWYEKALNDASTEDCPITDEEKADLAYRVGYHKFIKGDYSEARTLCNKAADLKPGWGEPYMLIGNMYASSGKRCSGGVGTGWDAQVVAWAATDMWIKARNTDPNVASEANAQISKYKKYMPTTSDIFARGYKEGQSYSIGCWIGVTTTIRSNGE